MSPDPTVRRIDDARALKALAHPLRWELLEAVNLHGPLTATAAAERVGESPANCSWHLRQLAKYGFIEAVPGATGRERPWRRAAAGLSWDAKGDPGFAEASRTLTEVFIERDQRVLKDARLRIQPPGWEDSVMATNAITWLTAEELDSLAEEVMALFTRYRGRFEDPAKRPEGSRPVRLLALASPDDSLRPNEPELPRKPGLPNQGDDHA